MSMITLSHADLKRIQQGGSKPKNLVDIAALATKPLPKPPHDSTWVRDDESGEYKVVKKDTLPDYEGGVDESKSQKLQTADELPEFIYHIVMPEDTLVGICMRYRVNKRLLQRHNAFVDDFSFRCCEKIKIPTAALKEGVHVQSHDAEAVKLQKMKNATKLPTIEAKLYLDDHDWNVDAAIESFHADNKWEDAVRAEAGTQREMVPMRSGRTQAYEPPSAPTPASKEQATTTVANGLRAGFHPVYTGVPVAGVPDSAVAHQPTPARAASPPASESANGGAKPAARRSSWGLF